MQKHKGQYKDFREMKEDFSQLRWEPAFHALGSKEQREKALAAPKPPTPEESPSPRLDDAAVKKDEEKKRQEEEMNFLQLSLKSERKAQRFLEMQRRQELRKRAQAEANYKIRVDKTILHAMYVGDDKEFQKVVSKDKFNLKKTHVSPFVNTLILDNKLMKQKEAQEKAEKEMKRIEESFRMIFREVDEDDSEEEDVNLY